MPRPSRFTFPAVGAALSHRSPRQDDFAKRPILDQMAQGLAHLAEGIEPLDDRLDGSADDQREDVAVIITRSPFPPSDGLGTNPRQQMRSSRTPRHRHRNDRPRR